MKKLELPTRYKRSFTPKLALDFASLMEKQASLVYEKMGIVLPVITSSTVCFIGEQKKASLLEIARALNITHQLAAQRIKILLNLEIISASKDLTDKRRTNYALTVIGQKQNLLLIEYLNHAEQIFVEFNKELGTDLMTLLIQVNKSFTDRSLFKRIFVGEE
jgi:DNA-binding MarR family transcriptional regulator